MEVVVAQEDQTEYLGEHVWRNKYAVTQDRNKDIVYARHWDLRRHTSQIWKKVCHILRKYNKVGASKDML